MCFPAGDRKIQLAERAAHARQTPCARVERDENAVRWLLARAEVADVLQRRDLGADFVDL